MASLGPMLLGYSSLSTNHTVDPRLCLAEETFILRPLSLSIMARSPPLFMNTDLHNYFYLSSDNYKSSDWAPGPIYTIGPINPTVTFPMKYIYIHIYIYTYIYIHQIKFFVFLFFLKKVSRRKN